MTPDRAPSDPHQVIADQKRRIAELEAQQAATTDVLNIISRSAFDLNAVLQTVIDNAAELCGVLRCSIWFKQNERMIPRAFHRTTPPEARAHYIRHGLPLARESFIGRAFLTRKVVCIGDVYADKEIGAEAAEALAKAGNRSVLCVPLLRIDEPVGVLAIGKNALGEFPARAIDLLKTFADQAVIAIENARLFNETKVALERQTATSDILKVIASSPTDLKPVFDAIAERSNKLIGGHSTTVHRFINDFVELVAFTPVNPEADALLTSAFPRPLSALSQFEIVRNHGQHLQTFDTEAPEIRDTLLGKLGRARGFRSRLLTPLIAQDKTIGLINVTRKEAGGFADADIALMKTFADQAVIAIQNVRLFNETQEALERQTATSDILKVIAESPTDLQPVFDAIAERSNKLIGGHSTTVNRFINDVVELVAFTPVSPEADAALRSAYPRPVSTLPHLGSIRKGQYLQTSDTEAPEFRDTLLGQLGRARGFRSRISMPLIANNETIGQISVTRKEPGRFLDADVALLKTFADQAVIAIGNARLFNELQARTKDLTEALERQTATNEILGVISASTTDATPVFEAVLRNALRFCKATRGIVFRYDGELCRVISTNGLSDDARTEFLAGPFRPTPLSGIGRALSTKKPVQIADVTDDEAYRKGDPLRVRTVNLLGARTAVWIPLMLGQQPIGALAIFHQEVRPFTATQIELVQTFGEQAVIAIENARLFEEVQTRTAELTESLEYQTATSDVLGVISRSPSDVQPVLDAIVVTASSLCQSDYALIFRVKNGDFFLAAVSNMHLPHVDYLREYPPRTDDPGSCAGRVAMTRRTVHIEDVLGDPHYTRKDSQRTGQYRSMLGVPLLRGDVVTGVIVLMRTFVRPFNERQVELVTAFADQAVIAIENARLFEEVQARTRDLEASLEVQTATSDVLKIISRSVFDLQMVLDALIDTGVHLCGGLRGIIFMREGELLKAVAFSSQVAPELRHLLHEKPLKVDLESRAGRAVATKSIVSFPDGHDDGDFKRHDTQQAAGYKSYMAAPLMAADEAIGVFAVSRDVADGFTGRQIELIKTFADQAVIAIQNARLIEQVQARTHELQESLAQQTATSNVLKAISRSAFDVNSVLSTLIRSATELCGVERGLIFVRDGEEFRLGATVGVSPERQAFYRDNPRRPGRESVVPRVLLSKQVEQIPDTLTDPDYTVERDAQSGTRALLGVPLLRDGEIEGVFTLAKKEPGLFPKRQVELAETFADQAVIAMANARLFDEVQARTRELSQSLNDLRAAQDRLIQSEKLASLGQLTAGIAHEIKNPLNFVNNFSALSVELVDELGEVLEPAPLDPKTREEVNELTEMLRRNLAKVVQHGKRADSIVKNMLLHSREGSGERRAVAVNHLVEESVNLAYHGARAEKPGFNITLVKTLAPDTGVSDLYPQEITRVLLNLISNGFYAATKRKIEGNDAAFEPTLTASTRNLGDRVEIKIRDNGTGIPPDVKVKMFNPFFTTKPAGEGTGLGLSLSYDIVVKQHGGTIEVDTVLGAFTEFTVVLPRAPAVLQPLEAKQ